ncbi:MAG: domain S-box protein [Alphaproteobacteria bacterium]|nr:domain S-box protein [Alphaproteobacteria bacterium]
MNRELAAANPALVGNGDLLRGILSGCGDCIKILDLDGRLQFMSDGGKRVMEVDDFSVLKGCPWPDFWAGEGNIQATDAVATAKAGRIARFQNAANTAKGTPRYWDVQVSPIFAPNGEVSHLLSISRDITEEWRAAQTRKENMERHKFLTEELTHRVKNTLATVLGIAQQTFKGDAHKAPREVFTARIKTLSDAYNILAEDSWTSTAMRPVIESALLPYRMGSGRFTVSGPDHTLLPKQALTLALALNELATNAMKYGALSTPDGEVNVVWTIEPSDGVSLLQFEWRESGGPTVATPTRFSFGSRLIKTLLPADFGGAVDVRYEPEGLVCLLRAPLQ